MSEDSDPPSSWDDHEESTLNGVEDVPKPMRQWAHSQSRRVRRVEKWGEKGGMLYELHEDWTAIKKFVGVFKWLAPMIGGFVVVVAAAIVWLVQHAATQPAPPNAQDIARELAKQHDK